MAHVWWIYNKLTGKLGRYDLTISNGFLCTLCDVCYVHFSHYDYAKKQFKVPLRTFKDMLELIHEITFGVLSDYMLFWSPAKNTLLTVSHALATDLRKWSAPWKTITTIPNCAPTKTLDNQTKNTFRSETRENLQIADDEIVFAFISQGHYRRKGFWLAIEALSQVRKSYKIKFLVVGGYPNTLKRVKRILSKLAPDWSEWVIFTGMVTSSEPFLSASDALLFPSYSEAFSLVEIEAAHVGARLFLTPHYGAEMTLLPEANGRLIPWNASEIASAILEDISNGVVKHIPEGRSLAISSKEFATQFITLHRKRKPSAP